MYYVKVFDLLFNGANDCDLLEEKPKEDEYLYFYKEYDFARGCDLVYAYYKNICLGVNFILSIGFLNGVLNGLRGKGVWKGYNFKGDIYTSFSYKEKKVIKKLGIWVF